MDIDDYREHRHIVSKAVRHVAYQFRFGRPDAEDFEQDVWLLLISKKALIDQSFAQRSSYSTYLTKIIWNFGANWRRARARLDRRFVWCDDLNAMEGSLPTPRFDEHQVQEGASDLERRSLATAMARLRDDDRQLLSRWATGRPLRGVADGLGVTPNAVYCRVSRLLRKLRQELAKEA
jgi:RNA polymerase sigma factor (sigma-70 family)